MTHDDLSKAMACLLAWQRGRDNGTNGMLGILFAVRNRVSESRNWIQVVSEELQEYGDYSPDTRNPEFLAILQHIDGVYEGVIRDNLTNGALYFYDQAGDPLMYDLKHERCAQIGTLVFLK